MNRKKDKPKISIIMPVYNSEKFLDESIKSILNQTFKDFEFIIINDCSTDKSLEIIKEYQNKDNRIKVINNKKNLGRAKSRNKALKISKGKYVAIMDSDDISLPKRLEKQYNYLEKNKDIFLLGTGWDLIDEEGNKLKSPRYPLSNKKISKTLPRRWCILHPSCLFRNNRKIHYREKFHYSQDYDLFLRLLSKREKLVNIPERLVKYRVPSTDTDLSKRIKQRLFSKKAKEFYKERVEIGKDNYEEFEPQTILNIEKEDPGNRVILEQNIYSSFKVNAFEKTRKNCKEYFKKYGFLNVFLAYYLFSFAGNTGKKILISIKKILFNY